MLTTSFTTTPNGAMWTNARACGIPAIAVANDIAVASNTVEGIAMKAAVKRPQARPQADVFGGSYGTHVSNGTTLRPEGLGGRAG